MGSPSIPTTHIHPSVLPYRRVRDRSPRYALPMPYLTYMYALVMPFTVTGQLRAHLGNVNMSQITSLPFALS